jgi:rare lipoprotein A
MTTQQIGSSDDHSPARRLFLHGCFAGFTALACAATGLARHAFAGASEQPLYRRIGTASWYGRYHQGRRMANGNRFNLHKLTAAHRSLPLSTTARVTNLDNGREVKVRITDRGPYGHHRLIDLSEHAAQLLGMRHDGVATVKVEVLPSDQETALSTLDAGKHAPLG